MKSIKGGLYAAVKKQKEGNVIISNSKRFIYIHPHKTAGTSIERAIDPHLQWNDIILGSTDYGEKNQQIYRQRFHLKKHATGQECFDVVGATVWDSYFTFATVRNPYSLAVSTFTYAQRILNKAITSGRYSCEDVRPLVKSGQMSKRRFWRWPTFKQPKISNRIFQWPIVKALMESGYPEPSFARYLQSPHVLDALALKPQWDKLAVSRGDTPRIDLDCVVKMEELDRQWPELCRKIGIDVDLPHVNKSSGKKRWQEFYVSNEIISLLERRLAADFEAFGYDRLRI